SLYVNLSFYLCANHRDLPSFPTRRSSDLESSNGTRSEEPVIAVKGVLRVTSRYQGVDTETRNRQSEGRLSIARMLSMNPDSRSAHLGLFELARTICTPESPRCSVCPLLKNCKRFGVDSNQTLLEI